MMAPASRSSIQERIKLIFAIEKKYLFVSLALLLIVSWVSFSGKQGPLIELYDYWEHAASINEMSKNLFEPTNPFLQLEGSTTLRYTPYIFLLALIKKTTGCDLFLILSLSSILNFILLIMGVHLFCREYFNDREQSLYTLVTLLFLWGEPFNFSSEYNLRFLSYTSFYPSEVTFSLSFIGFYYFLKFVRYSTLSDYWKYLLLATFIFSAHPLTGSFFLLGIFLLTLTEGERKFRNSVFYLLSVLIVFLILIIWPYYPFLKSFYNTVSTPWAEETRGYLYATRNIYKMGAAVLGAPVILLLLLKRKYQFVSYGFILCAFIYVFTYQPKIYLGERYIFYIIVYLHLALAWYLKTLELLSFRALRETLANFNEKNLHVLIFAIILMLSVCYQLSKLGFEQMGYTIHFRPRPIVQKYENPIENYEVLKGKIKDGDIVISDPLTSWIIPALTGAKVVGLYHDNPLVPDNPLRVEDSITFYNDTTPLEKRVLISKKYNVTHALLNFNRMEDTIANRINDYNINFRINETFINDLKKVGKIILRNDNFILFKLNFTDRNT